MATAQVGGAALTRAGRRRVGATALFGCVLLAAGCSSAGPPGYVEDTYPVTAGHVNHAVVIGHGRLGEDEWTLSAAVNPEGQLCLGTTWRPKAGRPGLGCGFGSNQISSDDRGFEPTAQDESANHRVLAYGPSPAGAVRAVLREPTIHGTDCQSYAIQPTAVAITHRLPGWYPVQGAGWFAMAVPRATSGCGVFNVRFVDSRNRTVAQPKNF